MKFGECGHPLVTRRGVFAEAWRCRVCPILAMTSQSVGDDDNDCNDDEVHRTLERKAAAHEWRGREDEANACDGPARETAIGDADLVRGRLTLHGNASAYQPTDDESVVLFLLHAGSMRLAATRMGAEFIEVPEIAFEISPRNVPAWNEPRAVTFLRGAAPRTLRINVETHLPVLYPRWSWSD